MKEKESSNDTIKAKCNHVAYRGNYWTLWASTAVGGGGKKLKEIEKIKILDN